jgi:anti-sigma regulatory factor (Ser/Thr protein kinase)
VSPSSNGNSPFNQTYIFNLEDQSQIGEVRRFANSLCDRLDFSEVKQGRVSIIINELATNLLKYSQKGQLLIRIIDRALEGGIEITSVDLGPGIENTSTAMTDGYSTGSSPGTGLGSVKRQADEFDIYSEMGKGSIIYAAVYQKEKPKLPRYSIGSVSIPMKGEILCGDAWCISEMNDQLQILMVDGLGHGPMAHQASFEAIDEFKKSATLPILNAFNSIHERLRGTRGGAVQLCRWNQTDSIEYVSAGNIRTVIQTNEKIKTLVSQNGTAGVRVSNLKTFKQDWSGEGFLILHSDGINSRWDLSKYPGIMNCRAPILAAAIYRDFNRGYDDSSVLVIRGKN